MATSWALGVCGGVARPTSMEMASATTSMTVSVNSTAASAMGLAPCTTAAVKPAGDCDCDGSQLDALGVCGGGCSADLDGDGVCDDDLCVGEFDECGISTDPALYECGRQHPAGDCDCNGNQLDALGVCGGVHG